jgi:hypothetical protein
MSDTTAQADKLRSIAAQVISGDTLDSFCTYAPLDAYTRPDGQIDEEKVIGHLTAIAAATAAHKPGDNARDALAKRYGVNGDTDEPSSTTRIPRGQAGRAALAARYGAKTR